MRGLEAIVLPFLRCGYALVRIMMPATDTGRELRRTPFPRTQVHADGLDSSAPLACSQQASDKGAKRDPTARQPLFWERLQAAPAPRATRHSFRAREVR